MTSMTTITIKKEDKDRLGKLGDATESLGDVLSRLLDIAEDNINPPTSEGENIK